MNKDVSVIIVNWNTRDLLLKCIESVHKTIKTLSMEIFVVDNGSSDGSAKAAKERFPESIIIENSENLGFAKANNQALRKINGRYALLLNSDAILTEGAIENIVEFMDKNKSIGICGGQLLNADDSKQNSIANIPSLATELLNKSLLRKLFPHKYLGKENNFKEPVEVESIIGACMVVRKDSIDDIGLMDEDYFFFFEETDWCMRMRKKGWRIFHHPDAKIYHLQGQSAGKVNVRARIEYWRSRYTFFKKNYGRASLNILRLGLILKVLITVFMLSIVYAASLLLNKKVRERLSLYSVLIAWHFRGTPSEWGLAH